MVSLRIFLGMLAAIVTFSFIPVSAQFTPIHHIGLELFQQPDGAGNLVYGVEPAQFVLFAAPDSAKLVAPDGTEFPWRSNAVATRSSFAELADLALGDWTAIETYGTDEVRYQFRVLPFALGDVFSDIPEITSPISGSEVPAKFTLEWEFEFGSMPNGRGLSSKIRNLERVGGRFVGSEYAYEFEHRKLGPGPAWIDLHVDMSTTLPFPEIISQSGLVGRAETWLQFESRSAQAIFYVVPEPDAISILSMTLMGIALSIRRRRYCHATS